MEENYIQPISPMNNIPYYQQENTIDNLVAQIDPKQIIDNLDHALKGEIFSKEEGMWVMNSSGEPVVNDACRGALVSFVTGFLNNNTTMSIIDETQIGNLMKLVINSVIKMFCCNLEKFGFVPKGRKYDQKVYLNKGTPDTARMTKASYMVYSVIFLALTRAKGGMESKRIFNSLSMTDAINFGREQEKNKGGFFSKMFGNR